ncbi:MAG: thioredoxin [Hespellia sp.]|nr:thioredoxin [Hespellia sp.]
MVKKISAKEFHEAEASKAAVVDFSASWCMPCGMLAPVLEEVSEDMAGKMDFFNVDIDEAPDLATRFGVASIPCLVVLKDGEKIDQSVGFLPKEALTEFIEKNM